MCCLVNICCGPVQRLISGLMVSLRTSQSAANGQSPQHHIQQLLRLIGLQQKVGVLGDVWRAMSANELSASEFMNSRPHRIIPSSPSLAHIRARTAAIWQTSAS
jgi:hypothetical protein